MDDAAADIAARFNELDLHDDRLREVVVPYAEEPEAQVVVLRLQRGGEWLALTFAGCRYIQCRLDLLGKALCDDAIAAASCAVESQWKQDVMQRFSQAVEYQGIGETPGDLLHFRIEMVRPGGTIDLLAQRFEFR